MDYLKAQQTFGTVADNNLASAKVTFQKVTKYDGRTSKGREAMIDGLFEVEENLRIVKDQINNLRNLYGTMPIGEDK